MTRYIIRRLLQAIPLLFLISLVVFVLANEMGDPLASFGGRRRIRSSDRERLTRLLGLDKPITVQYGVWLIGNDWMDIDLDGDGVPDDKGTRRGVLRGDWGTSFMEKRPVGELIWERLPNTLLLMFVSEVAIIVLSLGIGVYSALRQYSPMDHLITGLSFVGYSMPIFWTALMFMYLFAVKFKEWGLPHLPTVGKYDLDVGPTLGQIAWHMILPVASISIVSIAGYTRFVRSSMLDVIHDDYIRTARSKGLSETLILFRHALKNAALPLVTIIGLDIPLLLGGAVVTESIFAWPGMGRLYWSAAQDTDIPVLMGVLMMISLAVVVFQILTDVVYTLLDPRIRYD
ncbi:MAG: ABC transporter permease [Chloroflexi bacterium]|nr:ABC transporter permease [Chloroflexota bacterium]MBL7200340.1 ABC transporter permease [Anaerolineae bacterium]